MKNQIVNAPKESERRHVTVLNCDIISSTVLTEHLDIEELDEIKVAFEKFCTDVIEKNYGVIGRYTGDGIEGYFGWPKGREDSVSYALLSALELREQISSIKVASGVLKLRIGVASGEAVVSILNNTPFGSNYRATGLVTNIAARLADREISGENQILVDDNTKVLCDKNFKYSNFGNHELRGISEPIQLWELRRRITRHSRFEDRSNDLSPLVGRETEQSILVNKWKRTLQFQGGLVIIKGEAGIGKSRLIHDFLNNVREPGDILQIYLQCSSQFMTSPLYPWIRELFNQDYISDNDSIGIKKGKFRSQILELGFTETFFEILSSLVGISEETERDNESISPEKKAEIVKEEIFNYFKAKLNQKNALIVVEDIHWADSTTLSLIEKLTLEFFHLNGLVITSSRKSFPSLENLPGADLICPSNLTSIHIGELIQTIANDKKIRPELVQTIKLNTDGIPLFVEEIVRSVLKKSGSLKDELSTTDISIPISLNSFLTEKLDGLGESKKVAQIASNFGREFELSALISVGRLDKNKVEISIEKLLDARFILKHESPDTYFFRHSLFQTVAYESQLISNRKIFHLSIAENLVNDEGNKINKNPELIAFHFEAAEVNDKALEYWIKAGSQSLESGATVETVKLLENANSILDLSNTDPDYLALLHRYYYLYGKVLNATLGARSSEAEQAFKKAGEIAESINDIDSLINSLDSEFGIIFNSGEIRRSSNSAIMMVRIGNSRDNEIGKICGYQSIGMVCFTLGKLNKAKMYLTKATKGADKNRVGINSYPSLAFTYLAFTNYLLDEKKIALGLCNKAIESARNESPYSLGVALGNSCYLYRFDEDMDTIKISSRELVEVTKSIGQMMWHRRGLFFENWCNAFDYSDSSYLSKMQSLIDELIMAKEEVDITVLYSSLAKAQIHFDLFDQATKSLDIAIDVALRNMELYYLPEIYRLYGELIVDQSGPIELSDHYFQLAQKTALNQNALAWLKRISSSCD